MQKQMRNPERGRDKMKVVWMKLSRGRPRFANSENSKGAKGGCRRFKAIYSMRTEILYASHGKFCVHGAESWRLASPRMINSNLKGEALAERADASNI